jgi:serine/threonine-protein kinase
MRIKGPFLTLTAGVVLAGGVFGLSTAAARVTTTPAGARPYVSAGTSQTATATPEPTATPAASGTSAPPSAAAPNVNYAGSAGGGSSLAIATKNGSAIAYLCDGKRLEAWLHGTAAGGKLALTGNQASLTGTYDTATKTATAAGSVTAGGKTWKFTIRAVTAPSGLYRATATVRNAKLVGGWIVLPDGRQVGIVSIDGVPAGAPALDITARTATVEGTPVSAEPVTGVGAF